MRHYEHIIWDWNGTLMDDTWLCLEVLNQILRKRDMPAIDYDTYRGQFGFPVIDFYKSLGFEFIEESYEEVSVEFITAYDKRRLECKLHTDVREALQNIADKGLHQYILSAYHEDALVEIVDHYGLNHFFKKLTGNNDIFAGSKIRLGLDKINAIGCSPHEILIVGDTLHDFEVAQAIGADCALVSHGHHHPNRLRNCDAFHLESLNEIDALISRPLNR